MTTRRYDAWTFVAAPGVGGCLTFASANRLIESNVVKPGVADTPCPSRGSAVPDTDFPWEHLLPLLSQNKTICRGILGPVVASQGSGPYEESDFDDFLMACGIEVRFLSSAVGSPAVVVLGREYWEEDDLDELWERTSGENVRVYSQEMVVASMAAGVDLFEHLGDAVAAFFEGHPALQHFYYAPIEAEADSSGVSTSVPVAPHRKLLVNLDTGEWPSTGVLGAMGYHVGKNGVAAATRCEILAEVLQVELEAASHAATTYIAEWGPPNSRRRLEKMITAIAAFVRIA